MRTPRTVAIDDGRAISIRYRSGCLEVCVGDILDKAVDNSAAWPDDVRLYRAKIGRDWESEIVEAELLEHLREVLVYRP